ncbi:MAG: aminotransferase class V-fold PLP-dependent enzyme [Phycisphaerae bacterium]|jgi:selenocysteine lyase/cysteine desulfurase
MTDKEGRRDDAHAGPAPPEACSSADWRTGTGGAAQDLEWCELRAEPEWKCHMNLDQIREKFPITRHYNFQNHAAIAPLSGPAAEALTGYAREISESAYLEGNYYRAAERVRNAAAHLLHADADEVTFVKNTSEGINYVANGIQWVTGDNVVSTTMEFAANVYPWLALSARGVHLKQVDEEDGRVPFDRLAAAIDKRTRVVAISSVQFSNGFRIDLTRLGELCKEKGVLLFVDAIQSLGVHPIDVRAMNIDFLAADGHKWLCGPEGAGIFYCRRELIGHLHPTEIGYLAMKHGYETNEIKMDLRDDARRFDSGVYNLAGICAMGASLNLLLDVGIDEVQVQVKDLTDQLVEGLRRRGWKVHSPRTPSEWSGIVTFSADKLDLRELRRHLRDEFRIVVASRLGRLRASPHFYNSPEEIDQLVEALPAQ